MTLLITTCLILATTTTFVTNISAGDESCINNLNAISLSNAEELVEVQATRLVNDELKTAAENWTLEELNTFLEDLEDEDDQGEDEDEDEELEFKPGYLSADQTFTAMVSYGFLAGDSGDLEAYRELYHDPYSLEGNVSLSRNFQVLKQYDFIPESLSQSNFRKLGGRMGLIIRGFEYPIPTPDGYNIRPELRSALSAYPVEHSEKIAIVDDFLAEWNGEDPIPQEINNTIEELCYEMEGILSHYIESDYEGITARWISDDKAEFLGDGHQYWGYCRALNKSYTDIVIYCVEELNYGVTEFMVLLMWVIPLIIWVPLMAIISATWGNFVDWLTEDIGPHNEYGMWLAFFKRDPLWHPTPLLNELDKGLQPNGPWSPEDEDWYPEASWSKIT